MLNNQRSASSSKLSWCTGYLALALVVGWLMRYFRLNCVGVVSGLDYCIR
uniref:Uncharacterized protein n=1 Tax=Arundo donax TaxID=35708 RepID=A0A0A9R4D6_ARUDO